MGAVTAASQNVHSFGDATLYQFRISSAADGDTFASGLSDRVISYWTQDRTNPATQASVGIAATESSGTFTLYPAEDAVAFDLFVVATGR